MSASDGATVDMLHPQSLTWERGFTLEPRSPRLLQSIADVYRQFATASQTDEDRAFYAGLAEKWSNRP